MKNSSVNIVPIKNGLNFRDLGGIQTRDGRRIRSGKLFRSGDFSRLNEDDKQILAHQIGIKHILDYRDQSEIAKFPDNLWQNSQYHNIPANPIKTELTADLQDIELLLQLKKDLPAKFMTELYRLLPFNNSAYKKLVDLLLNTNGESVVQHCAVGKDRTGIGVALTLFALNVDEETIMQDYLATETLLHDFKVAMFEQDNKKLAYKEVFSADPDYLSAALDEIKKRYQNIDTWLAKEYQLNDKNRIKMQDFYLESD
ncbi:tyrosine-protein phosphatase [Orbaceae bacterium ac157xtp]